MSDGQRWATEQRRMFLYKGKTLEEWLPEAVERIVEGFDTLKVILFGSLARGEAGYHSDVDLLIVFDHVEWENKRELAVVPAFCPVSVEPVNLENHV